MAEALPISFLSDYGDEDEFAGVCRAVIRQIAPDAPLIDLTHGIGRQGIRHGALALANALPFCPRASISRWSIPASATRGGRSR